MALLCLRRKRVRERATAARARALLGCAWLVLSLGQASAQPAELPAAAYGDPSAQAETFTPADMDPVLTSPDSGPDLTKLTPDFGPGSTGRVNRPDVKVTPTVRGIGSGQAGPSIPVLTRIPQPSERALGVNVAPLDGMSISTEVATGDGSWHPDETRLGWTIARQAPDTVAGLVWGAKLSGGVAAAGSEPAQSLDLSLGLRPASAEARWTIMPKVGWTTSYTGDPSRPWASSFEPRLESSARLFGSSDGALRASLDTSVGYKLPVAPLPDERRLDGSAMLRLKLDSPWF